MNPINHLIQAPGFNVGFYNMCLDLEIRVGKGKKIGVEVFVKIKLVQSVQSVQVK